MTPDQMSFRESFTSDAARLARFHELSAQYLEKLPVPSSLDELAGLTEAYAVAVAKFGATGGFTWIQLKALLADMRKHISEHLPLGAEQPVRQVPRTPTEKKPRRIDNDSISPTEVNLLRALLPYPNGAPLSVVMRDTGMENVYVYRAARNARERGLILHEAVKTNLHYYTLTDAGREALAKHGEEVKQRRTRGALIDNPRISERRRPSLPQKRPVY